MERITALERGNAIKSRPLESRFYSGVRIVGAGIAIIGVLALCGWEARLGELTRIHAGWASMKANTALGFALAGVALILSVGSDRNRIRMVAGLACWTAVALLGTLTLLEYAFQADLGIDQLLAADPALSSLGYPGRMAVMTALNFLLLGAVPLLSRSSSVTARKLAVVLVCATLLNSFVAILGYIYSVSTLYSVAPYSSVALLTAILFLGLGVASILGQPRLGLVALVSSPHAGGRAARRLLPVAILVPPALGWLMFQGQRSGLYASGFDMAAFTAANVVILATFILLNVKSVDNADAVRQEEMKFRNLLESAPEAMVIVTEDGRILHVNALTKQLFGYPPGELIGQSIEKLIPERYRASHLAKREWFVNHPEKRGMGAGRELVGLREDGTEFPIEVGLSPLETADGLLVTAAIRDIAARKFAVAELEAARQRAEVASHAKSDFLASMSHELRTPLNAVLGFAQMLELDLPRNLTASQKGYIGDILTGGQHLLDLVNEVLDLAGVESGRLRLMVESVAVDDVLEELFAAMSPLASKAGLRFEIAKPAEVHHVLADTMRLRQALINLVSNAIKYNRPGGLVKLTAAAGPGNNIRFTVADTGTGIPKNRQHKIFVPFERLGAEYTAVEGTGIGLALSRQIIEAMNGTIGFASELGVGSEFWIELPGVAVDSGGTIPSSSPRAATQAPTGGFSLLYVEDNPSSLRLMESIISTLPNVTALIAQTPQLGLEMAIAHVPDVIVLDLNLPDLNGYELLTRLRARPETRNIPVMALTSKAFPHDVREGLAAGFFRYLTKPLDVGAFLAAVSEALAEARNRRTASDRAPHAG